METSRREPASETGVYSLSEFESLANELSRKVNLFKTVWDIDPEAEFFGGTSRDYLYWLKGKLSAASNQSEYDAVVAKLRSLQVIDVRDFIIGESDVDIVAKTKVPVSAEEFGVKNIDTISFERFDTSTQAGKDEIAQGFIPVEKIRLGKDGVVDTGRFGNGIGEVYSGKISVVFSSPAEFASTRYAKLRLNHPILLALRYVRLTAMQYAALFGRGHPNKDVLLEMMGENKEVVKRVIAEASKKRSLKEYLENQKFREWINGTLKKGYRSYTNPTATKMLHAELGVEVLTNAYSEIQALKPYLFAKYKDETAVERALTESGIDKDRFYSNVSDFFPNGLMYHGTGTDASFKGILYQGVMESSDGVGGKGLYVVGKKDIKFAIDWGGHKDRVVQFKVEPNAVIADVSKEGYVQDIYRSSGLNQDDFCDKYGIDILKYEYDTDAFVVKNSNVLGEANGTYRQLKSFSKILDDASTIKNYDDFKDFIKVGMSNRLTLDEWKSTVNSFDGFDVNSFYEKLLNENEYEKASKILLFYEGDEQFSKLKELMESSIAHYESGGRQQIVENSYFTVKAILNRNFPDEKKWFLDFYKDKWRAFIVKAFQWEFDQWEYNEHLQIKTIIKQRFALIERGENYTEDVKAVVAEMFELYKEVHHDESSLNTTNHIYENTMTFLRTHFDGAKLRQVAAPFREALEESLFVKRDNIFPERAILELADFYKSSDSYIDAGKDFELFYVMEKYFEGFSGNPTEDTISRAFLSLILNDFKNYPSLSKQLKKYIQQAYIDKLLEVVDEERATNYLSILGSLSRISGDYEGLEKLSRDLKAKGYSKDIVSHARQISGKKSLRKTCRDIIIRLFDK